MSLRFLFCHLALREYMGAEMLSKDTKKKYWIATWLKFSLVINTMFGLLGLASIAASIVRNNFDLLVLGIFFTIYGIVFLFASKNRLLNPMFILDGDELTCTGIFGKNKKFFPLRDFEIILNANKVISLEKEGVKENINSHLLRVNDSKKLFHDLIKAKN